MITCLHFRNEGCWRSILLVWIATLALVQGQDQDEIVRPINRFLLRLGPTSDYFSIEEKAVVLWNVDNHLQHYYEDLYGESSETIVTEVGVTGLSVVPKTENARLEYEVVKFLGGVVSFDSSSTVIPTQDELQDQIKDALTQDELVAVLRTHFPDLETIEYVKLSLGNRGFDGFDEEEDEENARNNNDGNTNDVAPPKETSFTKPPPVDAYNNQGDEAGDSGAQTESAPDDPVVSKAQKTTTVDGNSGADSTTIGLSVGLGLAVTILIVLIAVLLQGRRQRMSFWRGRHDEDEFETHAVDDGLYKPSSSSPRHKGHQLALDEEAEPSLRLPRIWGVAPSPRMEEGTCSEMSHEGEDSVQEILTITSMGANSIRNVESFEHQKRLVDTLKKEMMASNAEIHPYVQDPHLDNTEPCALSPTDLSAAALQNPVPSHLVQRWPAPSESSVSGSIVTSGSESGYDSPSGGSSFRAMFGALQLPSQRRSQHDASRYPYAKNGNGEL